MKQKLFALVLLSICCIQSISPLLAQGLIDDYESELPHSPLQQEVKVSKDLIKATPLGDLLEDSIALEELGSERETTTQGDKLIIGNTMSVRGIVENGRIEARIAPDTIIDIADENRAITPEEITIKSVDEQEKNIAEGNTKVALIDTLKDYLLPTVEATSFKKKSFNKFVFEFGKKGKHLIFSKPVEIKIKTPYPDGTSFDIRVRHRGEASYSTSSLTNSSSETCDKKTGRAASPIGTVRSQGGYIRFYTCGASSFSINAAGGTNATNGLSIIVGDCAQVQARYLNAAQVYGGNPPASGCGTPSSWPALRIGSTTYGNGVGTMSLASFNSASTTGNQNGNNYTAITNIDLQHTNGLYYNLRIEWNYTSPNNYFTWTWKVNIPNGNTETVKFLYAMDVYIAGNDANDAGFYNATQKMVGAWDTTNRIAMGIRMLSGPDFSSYEVKGYGTVSADTAAGNNYDGSLAGAADNGLGVQWILGSTPGEYSGKVEWSYFPYSTALTPDLQIRFDDPPSPALAIGSASILTGSIYNSASAAFTNQARVVFTLPTNFTAPLTATTSNGWNCGGYNSAARTVTCDRTFSAGSPLAGNSVSEVSISVTPLAGAASSVTFVANVSQVGGTPTETPTNNNAASRIESVSSLSIDSSAPVFSSVSLNENQLIAGGNFNIGYNYSDNIAVNPNANFGSLYKWDIASSSYILYTPSSVLTFTGTTATATTAQIRNIPYGKYRLDVRISDTSNNQTTHSRVFYTDALLMDISQDTYDIDDISNSPPALEQTITVRTVGASFSLRVNGGTLISQNGDTIPPLSGGIGWGYHTENGSGSYTSTPSSPQNATIYSQSGYTNTNGAYNTYIFKIKYSASQDSDRAMGDYEGNISVGINANYP